MMCSSATIIHGDFATAVAVNSNWEHLVAMPVGFA